MKLPKPEDAIINPVKYWLDTINVQIEFARQSVHFALSLNPFLSDAVPTDPAPRAPKTPTTAKSVAPSTADIVGIRKKATARGVASKRQKTALPKGAATPRKVTKSQPVVQ